MGACVAASDDSSVENFNLQIKKSKLCIDRRTERIYRESLEQEKYLLKEFKKPSKARTLAGEQAVIEQIVKTTNLIHTYQILKHYVSKVQTYFHTIENDQVSSESLHPSFKAILYCQSIVQDPNIDSLCDKIIRKVPKINKEKLDKLDDDIIDHQKQAKRSTPEMCNNYILKLCEQESLDLQKINENGHQFRYGIGHSF